MFRRANQILASILVLANTLCIEQTARKELSRTIDTFLLQNGVGFLARSNHVFSDVWRNNSVGLESVRHFLGMENGRHVF